MLAIDLINNNRALSTDQLYSTCYQIKYANNLYGGSFIKPNVWRGFCLNTQTSLRIKTDNQLRVQSLLHCNNRYTCHSFVSNGLWHRTNKKASISRSGEGEYGFYGFQAVSI